MYYQGVMYAENPLSKKKSRTQFLEFLDVLDARCHGNSILIREFRTLKFPMPWFGFDVIIRSSSLSQYLTPFPEEHKPRKQTAFDKSRKSYELSFWNFASCLDEITEDDYIDLMRNIKIAV